MDVALEAKYQAMRRSVTDAGLFERTYGYYAVYAVLLVISFVGSLFFITVTDNLILQLVNAVFLAFMTVQGGMLGHDLAHLQVFESASRNRRFGTLVWGFFCGLSESDWYHIHNTHHEHVNQLDHDPDIDIPFFFSPKQVPQSPGFIVRTILPYQHIIFFLILPVLYITKINATWQRTLRQFSIRRIPEIVFALARFGILFFLVFYFLPLPVALAFLVVNVGVTGFYMSLVFAPNHKGEEILDADTSVTWLHQITSTRNVYSNPLIFFLFGGLNFQIEHHLFTNMPRPNYPKVHVLVKEFCAENGIPYYESTWLGSLREMYSALKSTAATQRA